MANFETMRLRDYLKATRRHLCIVGKFTDEKDPNERIRHRKLAEAAKAFDFKLYYIEREIDLDEGTKMRTVEILFPREMLDRSKKERKGADEITLPPSLRAKLKQTKADPAEIGGTLFVEFLDGLDAMLPFTHPNFDRLLTMAMIEYAHAGMRKANEKVTKGTMAEFLQRPDVNQSLTAYLRTDSTDTTEGKRIREAHREVFVRTVQKSAERRSPGFTLGEQGSKDGGSRIDQLERLLESFRAGLVGEPTIIGEADHVDNRMEEALGKSEFRRALEELSIPRGPGGEAALEWKRNQPPGAFVRKVYRTFHDARKEVYALVTCEPLLTLMSYWAISKYGEAPKAMATAIGREFYGIDNPEEEVTTILSNERIAAMLNDIGDDLGKTLRYEDANQQAVANSARYRAMDMMEQEIAWTHQYNWEQFKHDVLGIFSELLMMRLPGMKEFLDKVDEENLAVCRAFMEYQTKLRNPDSEEEVTSETLMSRMRSIVGGEVAEPVTNWIEEIAAAHPGAKGEALADAVEETFKKRIAGQTAERTQKFIKGKKEEIGEFADRAKEVQARRLETLRPGESEDAVSQTAPFGSPGVVARDSEGKPTKEDGKLRSERYAEEELMPAAKKTLEQRMKVQEAGTKEEEPTRTAPEERAKVEAETKAQSSPQTGEESGTAPTDVDPGARLALFTESLSDEELEEIAGKKGGGWTNAVEKAGRQARTEQNLETEMEALIDENRLFEDPKLARERGKKRALVFAEIIASLGRDRSVLSLRDRSVVVHFALRMIEKVGAARKWENEDGNRGREALLDRTVDETGNEQSGVQDIAMDNIFGGPKGSGKAGIKRLEQVFETWEEVAKSVSELGRQLSELEAIEKMLKMIAASGEEGWVTIVNETIEEHARRLHPQHQRLISSTLTGEEEKMPPPGIVYVTRQGIPSSQKRGELRALERSLFGGAGSPGDDGVDPDRRPPLERNAEGNDTTTRYQAEESHEALYSIPILVGPEVGSGPTFTKKPSTKEPSTEEPSGSERLPAIRIDEEGIWEAVLQLMGMAVKDRRLDEDRARQLRKIAEGYGVRSLINANYTPEQAWNEILSSDACLAQQFFGRAGTAAAFVRLKEKRAPTMGKIGSAVIDDLEALYGREKVSGRLAIRSQGEEGEHGESVPRSPDGWDKLGSQAEELTIGHNERSIPLKAVAQLVSRF